MITQEWDERLPMKNAFFGRFHWSAWSDSMNVLVCSLMDWQEQQPRVSLTFTRKFPKNEEMHHEVLLW